MLAPELPLLHIDAVLIKRVFVNLLENAAKYTPPETAIEIEARAASDTIVITLSDHGDGLPAGREEAIFEKFERGKREDTRSGVGLGLAICRAIMRAHGGTIEGVTPAGGGARFILTLQRGVPPTDNGEACAETDVFAGMGEEK